MGCIYNNFNGECSLFDKDSGIEMNGCGDDGICVCEEDPDPSDTCEQYESDYTCSECGADFNKGDECTCDEED